MSQVVLKDLPRYECLQEAAEEFPEMEPSAMMAFLHLQHATEKVRRTMDDHFDKFSISQGRFLILLLLYYAFDEDKNPIEHTPASLADAAQVTRATITGILDTLERANYIERKPAPGDRRKIIVQLTKLGRKFMECVLPEHFYMIASIFKDFSEKEREVITKLLSKLALACASVEVPNPANAAKREAAKREAAKRKAG